MEIIEVILKFIINAGGILTIFGITFVLEKKTIKIKPWTMIRKWLVGDLDEKVDKNGEDLAIFKKNVIGEIRKVDTKLDELTIERYMTDITDFASDVVNEIPKDEAQRRLILEKIDKYENHFHKNGYVAIKGNLIKELCAKENCGNPTKKRKNKRE